MTPVLHKIIFDKYNKRLCNSLGAYLTKRMRSKSGGEMAILEKRYFFKRLTAIRHPIITRKWKRITRIVSLKCKINETLNWQPDVSENPLYLSL